MSRTAASAPQKAVILRQRSPWQSQGPPTKDLRTPPIPPQKRGAPPFAPFAKGGSVELHNRWPPSCSQPLLCHPERRKIVRSRTILRSRGTPRLPIPQGNRREFSAGTLSGGVRGGNACGGQEQTPGT